MTSYTRKLYRRDPAAAEAFRAAQQFDNKLVYGKAVTLACFGLRHHEMPSRAAPEPKPSVAFGKRVAPPQLIAFEVSAPSLGLGKAVVRAADGFQARQEYASHHGCKVLECVARVITQRRV